MIRKAEDSECPQPGTCSPARAAVEDRCLAGIGSSRVYPARRSLPQREESRLGGMRQGMLVGTVVLVLLAAAAVLYTIAPESLTAVAWDAMRNPDQAPVLLKHGFLDYLATAWGLSPTAIEHVSIQITISSLLAFFCLLFALTSLVERKVFARIQNRYGPNRVGPWGLFQPIADGIKMLTKEDIVPRNADKVVHLLAPVVMLVPALIVLAILPYGPGMVPIELEVGILLFFALGAVTEVAVFMAGWGSSNKYSLLGAMRAIAQMISYEMPLILAAIAVVMMTGSLSPVAIVESQEGYSMGFVPDWFVLTPWGIVGFIIFFIAAQAESNRSPFDLPEGESELVAGHLTEYSGFKYAVFFMAEYIGLFAISGLAATLFLGGWHAPLPVLDFIPGYVWFIVKLYALVLLAIWIRGTVPRIRGDQLMGFAWKFMTPMGFATIAAAATWHYAGPGPVGWLIAGALVLIPFLLLSRVFSTRYPVRTYRYSER